MAVDHVLASGSEEIDPGLHHVLITFPQKPDAGWIDRKQSEWPPHAVKVNPFSLRGAVAAGQTIVDTPAAMAGSATARAVRAVAAIAYELLGGKISARALSGEGFDAKPLSGLTEAGNLVLRSALDPDPPFSSSRSFVNALSDPEAAALPRRETHVSTPITHQIPVSPEALTVAGAPLQLLAKRSFPMAIIGVAAAVIIGGAVFLALRTNPKKTARGDVVRRHLRSRNRFRKPRPPPRTQASLHSQKLRLSPHAKELLTAAVARPRHSKRS
jgi:hypothetical protein